MTNLENPNSSDAFRKIKDEYIQSLPEKLQSISQLIESLKKDPSESILLELRTLVHNMAGNAGSFGFHEATDLCKSWDTRFTLILKQFSVDQVKSLELDVFLQQLKQAFTYTLS